MQDDEVVIYSVGLFYLSICVPAEMSVEEIERAANANEPTGVNPWKISSDKFFTGQDNPCPCDKQSGRKHYLLSC